MLSGCATDAGTISATSAASQSFLDTLSSEEHEAVLCSYDDVTKTTLWSNFPVTFVEGAGVNLAELSDEQKTH